MAKREDCRICGSHSLSKFLALGPTPLANRFLGPAQIDEPEPSFPLDVYLCSDCSLVQVTEVVPPEVLFRDYIYVSGTSQTMPRHFAELTAEVRKRFLTKPNALVVEPASNDGTLLSALLDKGVRVLGVEPASNIATIARSRGIETLNDFFTEAVARKILATHGPASALIATNVFAHVDDINDFVRGVRVLLAPDGVYVFENSYVFDMLDHLEFDSVYHEHLCYFSVTALDVLFRRHGMRIFDVSHHSVHGGSLRVFVQHADGPHQQTDAPLRFLTDEQQRGVKDLSKYRAFAEQAYRLRDELVSLLHDLRRQGKSVAAYGASAKGNTLLNFMRIGPELISYVIDRNPMKQGKLTPGMHLPVVADDILTRNPPDYALILAWNFVDEILQQQKAYVARGGKFIVPIPSPRILPAG